MTNISLGLQVSCLEASLAGEEWVVPQERPEPTQEEVAVPPPPPPTEEWEVSTPCLVYPVTCFSHTGQCGVRVNFTSPCEGVPSSRLLFSIAG